MLEDPLKSNVVEVVPLKPLTAITLVGGKLITSVRLALPPVLAS